VATPVGRTLEDLRTELLGRCGFSAAGGAAGVIIPNMNSFLQNAQRVLYLLHDWARLRRYVTPTLGVGQFQLDYPDDCDPDRILGISIVDTTTSPGISTPFLAKGIMPSAYSYRTDPNYRRRPARWEPFAQIEFDACADIIYLARIFYMKALGRFTENTDRATLNDTLIFLFALADAKAHYRQPDAPTYISQRDGITLKLKQLSWARSVWNPRDAGEEEMLAKPVVI